MRNEAKTLALLDRLASLLGALAFATLLVHFGFPDLPLPPELTVAWSGLFPLALLVDSLARLLVVRDPWSYLRRNPGRYVIILVVILELSGIAGWSYSTGYPSVSLLAGQAYLAVFLFAHVGSWIKGAILANRWLANQRLPVTLLPVLTFMAAILAGGLVLWMPGMSGPSTSFLDSLFTAASALCVTGLTVYDVGSTLTPAGLAVLATLIQIGGIGTMTIMGALALWLGGGLSSRERMAFSELFGGSVLEETKRILGRVIKIVILFETTGTLLLWGLWTGRVQHPLLQAAFHSVSAFCNAGFCLFPDSLGAFSADAPTLFVMMSLIVAGGLGIPALADIGKVTASRLVPWRERLDIARQTKLVALTSSLLLIIGLLAFMLDGYLAGNGRSFLAALFQAVTTRTAGFQTESQVGFGTLGWATTLILMAIGASPQSTGGGIKTSVIARLFFAGNSGQLESRPPTPCQKKQWPPFLAAAFLASSYLMVGLVAGLALHLFENEDFKTVLFESFSALGTVGLSRDLTPSLGLASKTLLIALMFIGRVLYPTLVAGLVRTRIKAESQDNWA